MHLLRYYLMVLSAICFPVCDFNIELTSHANYCEQKVLVFISRVLFSEKSISYTSSEKTLAHDACAGFHLLDVSLGILIPPIIASVQPTTRSVAHHRIAFPVLLCP